MTDEFSPTATPRPEKNPSELAWAEWETIQKKIDNVSTFPFTIKTWTVAVSGALLGLGKGFDIPPQALFAVVTVPILFWAIEAKHHRVRDTLGRRAELLELFIDRLVPLPRKGPGTVPSNLRRELGRLPGIALSIKRDRESLRRERFSFARPEGKKRIAWICRNIALVWQKWIVRYADPIFYIFQVALVIAITSSLVWFRAPSSEAQKPSSAFPSVLLPPALPTPLATPSPPGGSPPPLPSPDGSSDQHDDPHLRLDIDANGFSLSHPDATPLMAASPEPSPSANLLNQPK
jgi:hypothetical protein